MNMYLYICNCLFMLCMCNDMNCLLFVNHRPAQLQAAPLAYRDDACSSVRLLCPQVLRSPQQQPRCVRCSSLDRSNILLLHWHTYVHTTTRATQVQQQLQVLQLLSLKEIHYIHTYISRRERSCNSRIYIFRTGR